MKIWLECLKGSKLQSENIKDRNSWKKLTVAQTCWHCPPKLRQVPQYKHRLATKRSVPRTYSTHCILTENGHFSAKVTLTKLRNCTNCLQEVVQPSVRYKLYRKKKSNATKLREWGHKYETRPQAVHQGSKNLFSKFLCVGLYNFQKLLPTLKSLVQKVET